MDRIKRIWLKSIYEKLAHAHYQECKYRFPVLVVVGVLSSTRSRSKRLLLLCVDQSSPFNVGMYNKSLVKTDKRVKYHKYPRQFT